MKNPAQHIYNEIMDDEAALAEDRMLGAMQGAVNRKKYTRTAIRVSAGTLVAVLGFWLILMIDHELPPIEIVDQSESPVVVLISDGVPEIEIIETTSTYVQYLSTEGEAVQRIDDQDLERIFEDRAFAIVDMGNTDRSTFYLFPEEGT